MSTASPLAPAGRLFLLLIALWAAIYLPGLGGPELKGEEGRRILPAVTMLETGNWLVPYVGGIPYLRKPPLINWLIAGAFRVTRVRNEFVARLPSVLAMLGLALLLLALGRGGDWMDRETALVAALLVLTPAAALDKGRLAEIEAVYLALSGAAIVLWLACWTQQRSPWLLWLAPAPLLGLALLTKAPLHLLFFYAVVLAVLGFAREWRLLWHPAHFLSIGIAGAIFAAWAVPYFHSPEAAHAAEVWRGQSLGRVSGPVNCASWAMNIPSALKDQLPWILLAPLLWRSPLPQLGLRARAMFRGTRLALVVCFFGLLLVPGVLPRYTLPLLAPFACLLAMALSDRRLPPPASALRAWWFANSGLALLLAAAACGSPIFLAVMQRHHYLLPAGGSPATTAPRWLFGLAPDTLQAFFALAAGATTLTLGLGAWVGRRRLARPAWLAATTAGLLGGGMLLSSITVLPMMNLADRLRPVAREIDELLPPGAPLCVFDPDYQPVLFYLEHPLSYADRLNDIAAGSVWVLLREEKREKLLRERPEYEVVKSFPHARPSPLALARLRS